MPVVMLSPRSFAGALALIFPLLMSGCGGMPVDGREPQDDAAIAEEVGKALRGELPEDEDSSEVRQAVEPILEPRAPEPEPDPALLDPGTKILLFPAGQYELKFTFPSDAVLQNLSTLTESDVDPRVFQIQSLEGLEMRAREIGEVVPTRRPDGCYVDPIEALPRSYGTPSIVEPHVLGERERTQWTEQFVVLGCGEVLPVTLHTIVEAGEMRVFAAPPGDTLGDPVLLEKALAAANTVSAVRGERGGCNDLGNWIDTTIAEKPIEKLIGGVKRKVWSERWVRRVCGRDAAYRVDYMQPGTFNERTTVKVAPFAENS